MIRPVLSAESIEDHIGEVFGRIRKGELSRSILVDLLSERHSVYQERPSYQINRIKGYALASFKETGLPSSAISFVLDELQNGRNAYLVGAAARGLRGAKHPKAQYVSFLIQSVNNLKYHDDSFDLTVFKPEWPLNNPSSGRLEIFRTLQWLKGYAKAALPELRSFLNKTEDFTPEMREVIRKTIKEIEEDKRDLDLSCCEIENKSKTGISWLWKGLHNVRSIGNLEVQNEKGKFQSLQDVIDQKPTVVAFFYTRCMNPNKCTLTINKMGWLQKELTQIGLDSKVNLLAFTYDPSYDTPTKMRVFGENRGLVFGPNTHVLRTRPEEFSVLSDFFQLGVNHVASTVNQHRIELFILNQYGRVATTYSRIQWTVEQVVSDLTKLVGRSLKRTWVSKILNTFQQVVIPILVVFFPKCPFCWAAYLSVFGISGLQSIPYSPWLLPLIIGVMVFNLVLLYRRAKARNGLFPFWISLIGTLLVGGGYTLTHQPTSFVGIGLIFTGAVLNSLSFKHWSKVTYLVESILFKLRNMTFRKIWKSKTEHNTMYE
ncbi:SCO family protein [uncultured Roseivirga sp.]|uniref:SCO family protein n=1 Tax=uncultured Roseivirga sp. TaxID=543088 RepID=UPI0030D81C8C